MSKVARNLPVVKKEEVKFTVKDTDFLLKLILESTFKGNELEFANTVLQKLIAKHKELIDA